jgi:hypothetical protein
METDPFGSANPLIIQKYVLVQAFQNAIGTVGY